MDEKEELTSSSATKRSREAEPAQTLLAKHILEYQDNQERTKKGAISAGIGILGIAVLSIGIGTIGVLIVGGYWVLILLIIIGAVLVPVGLIKLLSASMHKTKTVRCPRCHTEHDVFQPVRKYICPNCLQLLRPGKKLYSQPVFISCPYCGLKAAIAEDHRVFPCSNCGLLCTSDGQRASAENKNCPTCGKEVPKEVLYCSSCESILRTDCLTSLSNDSEPTYDEDWIAGKNAIGHFHFARALLERIRAETPCPPSQKHKESPIRLMERALLSLGEVAANPQIRQRSIEILPDVDRVYAGLLRWEFDIVKTILSNTTTRNISQKTSFLEEVIEVYREEIPTEEPHISARRQLENLLGDALESSGSIGKWNSNLLEWTTEERRSSVSVYMTDQTKVLSGCDVLRQEVARFTEWLNGGDSKSVKTANQSGQWGANVNPKVSEIVEEYSTKIKDEYIFFVPNIPPQKLRNALTTYAPGVTEEEVLLLIDDTAWGSAKDGGVLTGDTFYVRNKMEAPQNIALVDINSVVFSGGIVSSHLDVNAAKFLETNCPKKEAMRRFSQMLQDIQAALHPSHATQNQ